MSNSFFKFFSIIFISFILFVLLITCFFVPFTSIEDETFPSYQFQITSGYMWPAPGYTQINSYFGRRVSPTAGASSFHKGLDIGAPQGATLIAVTSGKITFTGFLGGGGYTITLSSGNMKFTYCHVSPNYIVKTGELVSKGQIIGHVGPKNVYGVPGNQYTDSSGRPTNGATTGAHLHFGVRVNNEHINPLEIFHSN